jgi:hypothetical protein
MSRFGRAMGRRGLDRLRVRQALNEGDRQRDHQKDA